MKLGGTIAAETEWRGLTHITCLAGGVGAARFLTGLREVIAEKNLTVIVNTGDDDQFHGLRVSPDLDIICYTLAGLVDEGKGWGIRGDTFNCLEFLEEYGNPAWFRIGDKDFGTHILRTQLLKQGYTLTEATKQIAARLGLHCKILPMSDSLVRTVVQTPKRRLSFQEYFVKEGFRPRVLAVEFEGIHDAELTKEASEAVQKADAIIICPSNPIVSIAPILSLKDFRALLRVRKNVTVAISPIVGGKTLKGPADQMMKSLGHESSAYGVARLYRDVAGTMIIDKKDREMKERIERLGMRCIATDTIMQTRRRKVQLAEAAMRSLEVPI